MAMNPQSPKTSAPCAIAMESTVAVEPAAGEQPVAAAGPAVREQDRLMPIANVVRVMRRVLPPHAKISDDAKDVIQECVSEFISFVTGEANERCHAEHRKTVTAEDIVWALERLGFDDYIAPLSAYIRRMRDIDGTGVRGSGRGLTRAPAPAVPVAATFAHGMHAPARPAAFPNAALVQRYGAPLQVPFGAAAHFAAHRNVLGGERSLAAYYGGAALVTGGSHGGRGGGGYADEASSSSNEEVPAAGTARRPQYPN